MKETLKNFIIDNWTRTVRTNQDDVGGLIGLPFPYTVPCISGTFQEMYYWDTYFTNIGLILSGEVKQAVNNVENVAYLIEKYGKMPNGNSTGFLNRSQPPFFSQMVCEIFEKTADTAWLEKIYPTVEKEYYFWQKNRKTSSGLNRYYCDDEGFFNRETAGWLCERCGVEMPTDKNKIIEYAKCFSAFAESGWDCTSRFGLRAHIFNPVCLNSLLYGMEVNLSYFADILNNGNSDLWMENAEKRKALMNELMCDDLGVFFDYDFDKKEISGLFSAASFFPLTFGLATKEQAEKTVSYLSKIETEYGIAGCENKDTNMLLQWDYPNGWACLHYMVIKGLLNYGYKKDAERIAQKYAMLVENNFEKTGNLWEKYNVVTAEVSTATEYETPTMMGWSAGVYLYVKKLLEMMTDSTMAT